MWRFSYIVWAMICGLILHFCLWIIWKTYRELMWWSQKCLLLLSNMNLLSHTTHASLNSQCYFGSNICLLLLIFSSLNTVWRNPCSFPTSRHGCVLHQPACFSLADLQITPRSASHANLSCHTFASASCRAFWRCATCRLRCTTEISSLNTWQFSLIFSSRWTSSCLNSMRRMFTVRGRFMQPSAFMWVSLWLQ